MLKLSYELSRAAGPRERKRGDGERAGAVEEVLREKRLAGTEGCLRFFQGELNRLVLWMRGTEDAPRDHAGKFCYSISSGI